MTGVTRARLGSRFAAVAVVVALAAATALVTVGSTTAGAVGPPDHLAFTQIPAGSQTAGDPWTGTDQPKVAIRDIANATVTASTSQIFLHISPGSIDPGEEGATLTCTANPVAAAAGVATFAGCSINRAGTFTLTAEDPTDGIAAVSGPVTIDPAAPSQLAFTTQPGYGTAGVDLTTQPVVSVQDEFGNTVNTNAYDVTLAIQDAGTNPGGGTLTCTPDEEETTSAGDAAFTGCQISVAGTGYTLVATSNPALNAATSDPFDVSLNAPATALAFVVQPSSGAPTDVLADFEVAYVDTAGRIVSNQAGNISVAIAPSPPAAGVLGGCTAPVAAVDGVATFTGCTISLAGAGYRFRASSGAPALADVDSLPFTIAILHLAFVVQPGDGTAGDPLPRQPVVAVRDANNRNVTFNGPIELHVTPDTGTSGAVLTCYANPLDPADDLLAVFALCAVNLPGIGYRLTATSEVLGLTANSGAFDVVGSPAQLAFATQPSDGVPGIPLVVQPDVMILDAAGQLVTTDSSTVVSLAIAPGTPASGGPGALTCAPATAVNGVAQFVGCKISQPGDDYQLKATSNPALTPAVSDPFDIVGGLQRIFGPDAIDTSIEVSRAAFPVDGSAGAVVLARSDFFSDALAGGPLAAVKGAPMLVTPGAAQSAGLDPRVSGEIQRVLEPGNVVYVLGGPLALAPGIDTALTGLGYIPVRVAGPNLYSTAVAIAIQLGMPGTVFLATGLDFADALSAVPAAIDAGGAILLTAGSTQSPETAAYLAAYSPATRYAIGGPLAAYGADPDAIPVFGPDLYGTSAAVAERFFPDPPVIGVATGLTYPDALSGGVFMATGGRHGPVLLVRTHTPLPPAIADYLSGLDDIPGFVFGGPVAVGDDVEAAIEDLL